MFRRKPKFATPPFRGRGLFATGEFRPGEMVYVMGGYVFTRKPSKNTDALSQRSEIQIGDNLFIGAIHPDDSMIATLVRSEHRCARPDYIRCAARNRPRRGTDLRLGHQDITHRWIRTDNVMSSEDW